ncbi:MAG: hypothetical protein QNK80_02885 [Akkermansiaceae bacterium]
MTLKKSELTKDEILSWLTRFIKDRTWLAEETGYKYDYVKNLLAPKANEPTRKFAMECERAFLKEERRRNINVKKQGTTVWDLVMFSGREVTEINEGRRLGGYEKVEDLYHDAIIDFCDSLISKEWDDTP